MLSLSQGTHNPLLSGLCNSIFCTSIKTRVGWCVVCAGKSAPSTDICLPICLSQKSLRSSLKHKAISSLEGSIRRSQQGTEASSSSIEEYSGSPGNILKTSSPCMQTCFSTSSSASSNSLNRSVILACCLFSKTMFLFSAAHTTEKRSRNKT